MSLFDDLAQLHRGHNESIRDLKENSFDIHSMAIPLMDAGDSFPASPPINLVFWNKTLGAAFWFDGAAWRNYSTSSGSSFPASPQTNMLFFRTNLGRLCWYDGTRWRSVDEKVWAYTPTIGADRISANLQPWLTMAGSYNNRSGSGSLNDMYLTRASLAGIVQATNNAANYWKAEIRSIDNVVTYATVDTSLATHDVAFNYAFNITTNVVSAAVPLSYVYIYKAGTGALPGSLFYGSVNICYQDIII